MKSINKTIAGICRRLRHLIGLTREKVAEETGLNLHDIVRAETGEENFSLEKLRKLADYYGVSMPSRKWGRSPTKRVQQNVLLDPSNERLTSKTQVPEGLTYGEPTDSIFRSPTMSATSEHTNADIKNSSLKNVKLSGLLDD